MKKVLLFVLGMAMILSLVGSGAGAITADGSQSQTATVKLTISSSYTVTIPHEFTINPDTRVGQGSISCQVYTIPSHQNVTTTVYSGNYDQDSEHPNAWALNYNSNGHDDYVAYFMGVYDSSNTYIPESATASPVVNDGIVLDVPANTPEPVYKYLHFRLIGEPEYSGGYSDTLTFSVELTNNRNIP